MIALAHDTTRAAPAVENAVDALHRLDRRARGLPAGRHGLPTASRSGRAPGDARRRLTGLRGGFDAAATNRINEAHWENAALTTLDALLELSGEALRKRCHYEARNNSYAKHIVSTLANYIVGATLRIQLDTGDADLDRMLEDDLGQWAEECDVTGYGGLLDLLLLDIRAQCKTGDAFGVVKTDPDIEGPIQLGLLPIDAERVATPWGTSLADPARGTIKNGIRYNALGRPVEYYVLREHPGDSGAASILSAGAGEHDTVAAANMTHLYLREEASMGRGVPWLTSSLPLLAYLRRYTLATIDAAETAAKIAAMMESQDVEVDQVEDVDDMEEIDIPRSSMLTVPRGWRAKQMKAEQPAAQYESFKHEQLAEIGAGMDMPRNIAGADSSEYNYASGRLDHQAFFKAVGVIRVGIRRRKIRPLIQAAVAERRLGAVRTKRLERKLRRLDARDVARRAEVYWDGQEHVDPQKEALAQNVRLGNGATNLAREAAREGRDWQREADQLAREVEYYHERGLMHPCERELGPAPPDSSEEPPPAKGRK